MQALLLDDNLMSTMRIEPQLRSIGYTVRTGRKVPEGEMDAGEAPELVIINLGSRMLNGAQLIPPLRSLYPEARIVGFCGHLEIEIRQAAKAAGIDKLLTNDQAYSQLSNSL
jgi:DNA-binding NarL/FixJ family response regulator